MREHEHQMAVPDPVEAANPRKTPSEINNVFTRKSSNIAA
jgi:hypothetical protein